MTKEQFLQNLSTWYDNSDIYYTDFVNEFEKDKQELAGILSESVRDQVNLLKPKSKEDWLKTMITHFNKIVITESSNSKETHE